MNDASSEGLAAVEGELTSEGGWGVQSDSPTTSAAASAARIRAAQRRSDTLRHAERTRYRLGVRSRRQGN